MDIELNENQSKPVQLVEQVQVTHDEHQQSGPIEQSISFYTVKIYLINKIF